MITAHAVSVTRLIATVVLDVTCCAPDEGHLQIFGARLLRLQSGTRDHKSACSGLILVFLRFPASSRRPQRCLLPPKETDPLLNVVSRASAQGPHCDLNQATQPELSQSDLGPDPAVGKFCHGAPLPVNLFCLPGVHLGRPQPRELLLAHHRWCSRVLRTALRLESTSHTVDYRGSVVVMNHSRAFVSSLRREHLVCRTSIGIALRMICKGLAKKGRVGPSPSQTTPPLSRGYRPASRTCWPISRLASGLVKPLSTTTCSSARPGSLAPSPPPPSIDHNHWPIG